MSKKIIIFDMDGVLFNTIPFARQNFIQRYPGVTERMYNDIHTGNYHEGVAQYDHLRIEETEEEKLMSREIYMKKKQETPLVDGMFDLLKVLHAEDFLLTVNTNAYERNCLPLFEKSGIRHLFNLITTAEYSKDKIEKFNIIFDTYGVSKGHSIFVTDALGDVRDAEKAGVPVIAVTWGVHDKEYFNGEYQNLVAVVDTVSDLENEIRNYCAKIDS